MSDPLEYPARRAELEPLFLASPLAHYARSERLDDAGLALALGCPPHRLSALRLCRAPAGGPPEFRRDVERIAGAFGLDADALADAVRRGQALERFRAGAFGTLLAARDDERAEGEGKP